MSDYVKAAVLGTEDYHATMRQAAVAGLQRLGGYTAQTETFADEPQGGFIQYPMDNRKGSSGETFHALSKFVKGYGWIAGGSVFHYVHNEKIGYGDIDVFCVSTSAYHTLKDCFSSYLVSEDGRSCVAENAMFGLAKTDRYRLGVNVNLLCPADNEDWTHPYDVLSTFDGITPPAVAIIEPGLAYTPFREDVLNKTMNYIGNTRNPVKMWRRVLKYYHRGCRFGDTFWADLLQDERTRQLVYLAQDMHNLNSSTQTTLNASFLHAAWAILDYEGYEEPESSIEPEYDDDWY